MQSIFNSFGLHIPKITFSASSLTPTLLNTFHFLHRLKVQLNLNQSTSQSNN